MAPRKIGKGKGSARARGRPPRREKKDAAFLRVKGRDLVDGEGRPVLLRGFALGGWLNTENFISGYPGTDHKLTAAMAGALGEKKARFLVDRFLDCFIDEDDVAFMASTGANFIRVPFNYRHLEDDTAPFKYKASGFRRLDNVIKWCKRHGLRVALDLHAAPGWQNPDWHCDNARMEALLWEHRHFQERTFRLWQAIAERYADEPAVAGYDLLNEPAAVGTPALNRFYRELVKAVRKVDKRHVVFIEGNNYAGDFTGFEEPFDRNLAYHCHHYCHRGVPYPRDDYNRETIAKEYAARVEFAERHNRPMWTGEFGSVYRGDEADRDRLRIVDDQMGIFEGRGHSWTIWTYKDIGLMGTACVREDSPYMQLTAPVRRAKSRLGTDWWGPNESELGPGYEALTSRVIEGLGEVELDKDSLSWTITRSCANLFSELLIGPHARLFERMSENEIDEVMQSFRFRNCHIREGLRAVIEKHCRGTA